MLIGVNARRLAGQRLGVGRYIEYMLTHWARMTTPSESVVAYLREPLDGDAAGVDRSCQVRVLSPRLTGVTWENLVLSRHAAEADVLFCPSYTAPLAYWRPTVVAIHSVNEAEAGTHPAWYRLTYGALYQRSARRATTVIVPSRSTLADIQRLYGIPAGRIEVIPQGADAAFTPARDDARRREIQTRYFGRERPFILFVGKLSQRRSVPVLVAAARELKEAGLPHGLLLLGPNHLGLPLAQLTQEMGVEDRVVQSDGRFADHRELVAVYNAAEAYVNASAYEGFSMTLVEAMACGLPVVVTRRAALEEIAGDAGVLVESPDAREFCRALKPILLDESVRNELGQRSVVRAQEYRWERFAGETLEVIRRAGRT